MLVENTLYGIIDKEEIALEAIRQFCPPEGYYVAFSGGKDSCVVEDLVKKAGVKYDATYRYTTVDPPELVKFIKEFYPYVTIERPAKSMFQLMFLHRLFPPTRKIRYCCEYLKETGGAGRAVVTGIRAQESSRRKNRKMVEGCVNTKRKYFLHPIIDWTEKDVWEYIKKYQMPYCSLYDEGWRRIGCVMCPASSNRKGQAVRWPKFYQAYLKTFNRLVIARKERGLKCTFGNGQEMMDWWLSG
jgi:phosphoadenosine phosphosulfate reductase